MSDPAEPPPPRKPIPLIIWAALGFVVVLAFAFLMRALNPPELGRTPPTPDLVAPGAPKAVSNSDLEPTSLKP